jgi:hypothetical protein
MAGDRSIHRMLRRRVAVATLAVAAVTAAVVGASERGRSAQLAAERAAQGALTLQLILAQQLDAGLADHGAVQRLLDPLQGDPAGVASGRLVSVAVLDADGAEVARVAMPGTAAPGTERLIPVEVPLHDSTGRVVGRAAAWYQISEQARAEAWRRLAGSVALGIGIVLATVAILYPVVARLMDRVEARERLL